MILSNLEAKPIKLHVYNNQICPYFINQNKLYNNDNWSSWFILLIQWKSGNIYVKNKQKFYTQ